MAGGWPPLCCACLGVCHHFKGGHMFCVEHANLKAVAFEESCRPEGEACARPRCDCEESEGGDV